VAVSGSQERDTERRRIGTGEVQLGYGKGDENGEKKMTGEEEAGVKAGAEG